MGTVTGVRWMAVCAVGACGVAALMAGEREPGRTNDEIVVTARGFPTLESRTPGRAEILDEREIGEHQAVGVPDLLVLTPGVSRVADGAWSSDVSIRGLSRDSVVFLIDGTRVNTATDLGARFGMVAPMDIERVEILKGPISSLYGSGSMGGVVNVITRSGRFAEQPEWERAVAVEAGSNPEGLHGHARGARNGPRDYVYGSQSYRDFASYEDGNGREVRNSQFRDWQTTLRAGRRVTDRYTAEADLQYFEGRDIGIPGSGTAPLPPVADVTYTDIKRALLKVDNTFDGHGDWFKTSRLSLYYQRIERHVRVDEFPSVSPLLALEPAADHDTVGAKWIQAIEAGDHDVTAGVDVWERWYEGTRETRMKNGSVKTDRPLPKSSFASGGVFIEDDWRILPRWTLNTGGRVDAIQVRNDATDRLPSGTEDDSGLNLHIGNTVGLTDRLNVKAMAASGYRAASLEERFQYLVLGSGVTQYGNPELDPERSRLYELGLDWQGDRLQVGVSVFRNEIRDRMTERFVDPQTIVNANVAEARLDGYEADVQWLAGGDIRLYGNVSQVVGRDTFRDEYLPDVAPLGGLAGLSYGKEKGLWGYLEGVFADRQDKVPEGIKETAGWAILNTRIGWKFVRSTTEQNVHIGVQNVFDKAYRNYLTTYRGSEFDEPGRSLVAGYQCVF